MLVEGNLDVGEAQRLFAKCSALPSGNGMQYLVHGDPIMLRRQSKKRNLTSEIRGMSGLSVLATLDYPGRVMSPDALQPMSLDEAHSGYSQRRSLTDV
jgi:hypothetical protein